MRADTRVRILGLSVDRVTFGQAVKAAVRIGHGREPPGYVVTAGALLAVRAERERETAALCASARLVVADGAGLIWASRRLGQPLPERIPGIELAERLIVEAAARRWRVFFLGGHPDVAERAAAAVERRSPGVVVAGTHHGFFAEGSDEERSLLAQIRRSRSRLLFCALGQPRQERFLRDHLTECRARLGIGLGGTFDVWAGDARRAPAWMSRASLEWLWRLVRGPSRAWRMRDLPVFVLRVAVQAMRR